MNGLSAISAAMDLVALADPGGDAERHLQRWLAMVKGRGACRLPDGTARLVESCLRVFADEVTRHRVVGPCPAERQIPLPLPAPGGWR
ncbi:MAG: NADH-ubiquinone oxidoreductase-F iron-sulfur binding region domain-containing protein [Acidimicrobiales bacterium]